MLHAGVVMLLLLNVLLATMNETVADGLRASQRDAVWSYAACILRLELTLPLSRQPVYYASRRPDDTNVNPAFDEVLVLADCNLCDDDMAVVRSIEEVGKDWFRTLRDLQRRAVIEVDALTAAVRDANHFCASAMYPMACEVGIPTARAAIDAAFASVVAKRAPEPSDRCSRLRAVQRTVQQHWTSLASALSLEATTNTADQHDVLFAMVHGVSMAAMLARAWQSIEAVFDAAAARWEERPEPTPSQLRDAIVASTKAQNAQLQAHVDACMAAMQAMETRYTAALEESKAANRALDAKLSEVLTLLHVKA
ncbi:hypothetical protein SDRG_17189 [Saprolegnia diclina VS20]|uniref:Uncharacterized protein n=1 Tax=Saprolegnia diclina (strain VS20) TaxID=1156394 RepID=T0PV93_SAPDV|nr:hypothetical protein SDRG_17189 [Saprolegnia diclina VS20]EQC24920.1 hypothetical protein SDRG_17189 [Saprolegnia diclina VS20]|eukprot:XP_008621648.1 hypothetical protein SDRG_17189 [Saprolegnia diclina VS20]